MKTLSTHSSIVGRAAKVLSALCLVLGLTSCTTIKYPYTGVAPSPIYQTITGNWQIALTATQGPVPFSQLAGYINEQPTGTAAGTGVDAALQLANPSACYLGAMLVPAAGQIVTDQLGLYSFTINGQYFDTTSTVNANANSFAGTYVVQDGCAGALGSSGTILGTRYADLNGRFAGSLSGSTPAIGMSLLLTQISTGNSDGTFDISGTLALTGLSCYSQGSLSSISGAVLGSSVQLVFNDPATSSQVSVKGTFDPTAKTVTVNSVDVSGGSCPGSLGTASLTLQS